MENDEVFVVPLGMNKGYKKAPANAEAFFVVPPGIEPGTHGFSVHCSTN